MNELWTSLGPHGRTKAVVGGSAMIITKDAQQLLQQIPATNPLDKIFCSLCTLVSDRCGDGSLRTLLLLQDMLQRLHDIEQRIHWLNALEIIARTIQYHKENVTNYMLARGTWWTTTTTSMSMNHNPLSRWSTVLLPGSNSAITSNLLQLLVSFLCSEYRMCSLFYHNTPTHFSLVLIPQHQRMYPSSATMVATSWFHQQHTFDLLPLCVV